MKIPPNFFFLLISPPDEVIEYVSFLKKLVRKSLGHAYDGFYSTAHLTLFQYHDFHNESKLYTFQERISSIEPFYIHIDGVRAFNNNRTIFLDIKFFHHVCGLVKRLDHSINYPHITIAKNLPPGDFNLVWPELQKFSYRNHFICDRVTVLKKINNRWAEHEELFLACS
jgi:2'-5' RNA ligase